MMNKNKSKKKWIVPIIGFVFAVLLAMAIFGPLLSMSAKDLPVAIVSLDLGVSADGVEMNAGDELVTSITGQDSEVMDWSVLDTEEEAMDALYDGDYYAAFIIPEDFTAVSAAGGEQTIRVVINQGKHPLVSSVLTSAISTMTASTGIQFETESINDISDLGTLAMLLPIACLMFTMIGSNLFGNMTASNLTIKGSESKAKTWLFQLIYIVIGALVLAFLVTGIVSGFSGIDLAFGTMGLQLFMIALSFMLLTSGSINLLGRSGVIIPTAVMLLGVTSVSLPVEFLPRAWQKIISSWEPLRYFGNGIREILYQGSGILNSATPAAIIVACVGIAFSILAIVREKKKAPVTAV